MLIPIVRNLLPRRLKSSILRVLEKPPFRYYLQKLLDLDTSLSRLVFRKKEFFPFNFRGATAFGNVKFALGSNDEKIYSIIEQILEFKPFEGVSPPILIDVGANIGLTKIVMCEFTPPDAQIISFEPGLQSKYIEKNVSERGLESKVEVVKNAVHSSNTTLQLYTYDESIVDSRTYFDNSWSTRDQSKIKKQTVDAVTLDTFLSDRGINYRQLQLIKTDCQGAEPNIFEGLFQDKATSPVDGDYNFGHMQSNSGKRSRRILPEIFRKNLKALIAIISNKIPDFLLSLHNGSFTSFLGTGKTTSLI